MPEPWNLQFNASVANVPEVCFLLLESAGWTSPGRAVPPKRWSWLSAANSQDLPTYNLSQAFESRWGYPVAGSKLWFRVKWVNALTGAAGPWTYVTLISDLP